MKRKLPTKLQKVIKYEQGFLEHPRNKNLTFNEEKHKYYVDNKPLDYSVSFFISKFSGKFEKDKIINKIIERRQKGELSKFSVYYNMDASQISKFWDQRRDDGTFLHERIEDFYKYSKMVDSKSKFYEDFQKFLAYHKYLKEDGWTHFISEMRLFSDKPWMGGTVDLIVYKKLPNGEYRYMIIDWKRSRRPTFEDKNKKLDYITIFKNGSFNVGERDESQKNIERVVKSPLFGKHVSTHLKHSLQLYTYLYVLEKYYSKDFFLFKPNQLVRIANVYFHDSYPSFVEKECIDVRKEVKEMFDLVIEGKV